MYYTACANPIGTTKLLVCNKVVHERYEHQTHRTSIEKRAKITNNIQLLIIPRYFFEGKMRFYRDLVASYTKSIVLEAKELTNYLPLFDGAFLGDNIIIIRLPSSCGNCSTLA